MLKSYTLFNIVLSGLILISIILMGIGIYYEPKCAADDLSWPEQKETSESQRKSSYEGEVTCNANCQVTFGLERVKSNETDARSDNRSKSGDGSSLPPVEERDLCQQARMAWWTRIIAYFTAIGAALLFWTIVETRLEIEGNRIAARNQLILENRAWLLPQPGPNLKRGYDTALPDSENPTYCFYVQWTNTGKTPAMDIKLVTDHVIIDHDAPIPDTFEMPDGDTGEGSGVIGPDGKFSSPMRYVSLAEMREIALRRKKLILWVKVIYTTIFDDEVRETAGCYEITTNAGPDNLQSEKLDVGYLNFAPKGKFNYAT